MKNSRLGQRRPGLDASKEYLLVITLRLHLDPNPKSNGALRVIPGSHKHGPMTDEERRSLKTAEAFVEANPGDILIMSPLLIHASFQSLDPNRRRIVHVDYLLS